MYGLRINGKLDISMVKSMILVEVITLNADGKLSFRYGNVFNEIWPKNIDRWGFGASYLLNHNQGTLLPFVRAKVPLSECKSVGIPYAGSVYTSVDAGNYQNQFLISFINNQSPPVEIFIYESISQKYKDTGYGMNIYNDQGEVTFSTRRPILSDLSVIQAPSWQGMGVIDSGVNGGAVFSGMCDWYRDIFGLTADKYGFSPLITSDNKMIAGLSMFQGASPVPPQSETPTYDFLNNTTLIAKV